MTSLGNRRGFTLIELLIAMAVFTAVMAGGLAFLRAQSKAFQVGTGRMDLLQNGRFALDLLHQDLRVVGANVPDQQPALIYAGAEGIAYSGDHVTNVANDPFAVYYDPHAPAGGVSAPLAAGAFGIPGSGQLFPSVDYAVGGVNSPAEVITFFFAPDTGTARPDDFALFRQVNGLPAELVARDLLRTGGGPFFEYLRLRTPVGAPQELVELPGAALPLFHSVPEHLAPADTGADALIDSIRAVRVRFTATNGLIGDAERTRDLVRLVRLPNAGLATRHTCGDEPQLGTTLQRTVVTGPGGESMVQLTWTAAIDETQGERDVVRYVLWRRPAGVLDWGDPYLSVPAGQSAYLYQDAAVSSGQTYVYQLAAQDCTPLLSAPVASAPVVIP